jgi:hypothetical protein
LFNLIDTLHFDDIFEKKKIEKVHLIESVIKRVTLDNNKSLPLYNIQSANPVGKANIDSLLINYIRHMNKIN